MYLYHFDETGKYTRKTTAVIDETLSEIAGRTVYKPEGNAVWEIPEFVDGFTPYYRNGKWENVPNPTLEEVKTAKLAEINATCDRILNDAVASYPQSEIMTFDQQVSEVEKYRESGNVFDAPLVAALSAARGVDFDELCSRIIEKHRSFSWLSGYVIGCRQHLEDILDTLETIEAVQGLSAEIELPSEKYIGAEQDGSC